jgi:transposase
MRDKYYNRQTRTLLPAPAEQYIGQDKLSRFIVDAVAKMDLDGLRDTYSRRGSSHYPPEMMPALLLYAYVRGVTSSRET